MTNFRSPLNCAFYLVVGRLCWKQGTKMTIVSAAMVTQDRHFKHRRGKLKQNLYPPRCLSFSISYPTIKYKKFQTVSQTGRITQLTYSDKTQSREYKTFRN